MKKSTLSKFNSKASITIFVSMILIPILILVSTISESARISAQKAILRSSTYLSAYSVLGAYAQEVFDEYGIFILYDSLDSVKETCCDYLTKNLNADTDLPSSFHSFYRPLSISVDITNPIYITDEDCRIFARQAVSHSKSELIKDVSDFAISTFHENISKISSRAYVPDYDSELNEEMIRELQQYASTYLEKCEETDSAEPEDPSLETEGPLPSASSLKDKIKHILETSLLAIVLEDPSSVSSLVADITDCPSNTVLLSEEALAEMEEGFIGFGTDYSTIIEDNIDNTFFIKYLSAKFPCFTDFLETSSSKTSDSSPDGLLDDSVLSEDEPSDKELPLLYQLEYVLGNTPDDTTNFLQACLNIVSLRSSLNLIYLISDSQKREVAHKIAESAVGSIPVPGIVPATTYIILSLWASAEAVIDVQDLCKGKKVPIFKSADDWNLSISGILSLETAESKNAGRNGLSYKDYLLTMLMLQNKTSTYLRTMDLIQLNISQKYLPDFRLSSSLCGFTASITTHNSYVFSSMSDLFHSSYTINDSINISY